jgi:WD40 repeat protein
LAGLKVKFFLTSRPEQSACFAMEPLIGDTAFCFELHQVSKSTVTEDIREYLDDQFLIIRRRRKLPNDWPSPSIIEKIAHDADGLFIYAATVCRFLQSASRNSTHKIVSQILANDPLLSSATQYLDEMYTTILCSAYIPDNNAAIEEVTSEYQMVVGTLVVLADTLSAKELGCLLACQNAAAADAVYDILEPLSSVIQVVEQQPIRLLHTSFRDFILDNTRCTISQFCISSKAAHLQLAKVCLSVMTKELIKNITKQDVMGIGVEGVKKEDMERYIPPHLAYACRYWLDHCSLATYDLDLMNNLRYFLEKYFCQWIEASAWLQEIPRVISILTELYDLLDEEQYQTSRLDQNIQLHTYIHITSIHSTDPVQYNCWTLFRNFVYEMRRFVIESQTIISMAPLQVYYAPLAFSPRNSLIKKYFSELIPGCIGPGSTNPKNWSPRLFAVDGCTTAEFSADSKSLGSYLPGKHVQIQDAMTGVVTHTLPVDFDVGPQHSVARILFSKSGDRVVLIRHGSQRGGYDIVNVWDTSTGSLLHQVRFPNTCRIQDTRFTEDGEHINLLISNIGVLCIRAIGGFSAKSDSDMVIHNEQSHVRKARFTTDQQLAALYLTDGTVVIRKCRDGSEVIRTSLHREIAGLFTFLCRNQFLAVALEDYGRGDMLKILDVETGQTKLELKRFHRRYWIHRENQIVDSLDGRYIAFGMDYAVQVYDFAEEKSKRFVSFNKSDVIVKFTDLLLPSSNDILVASTFDSIHIWDLMTGTHQYRLDNVYTGQLSISADGLLLCSTTILGFSRPQANIWQMSLLRHSVRDEPKITVLQPSPRKTLLASVTNDRYLAIREASHGDIISSMEIDGSVVAIRFSHDDCFSVVLSTENGCDVLRIIDIAAGKVVARRPVDLDNCNLSNDLFTTKLLLTYGHQKAVIWDIHDPLDELTVLHNGPYGALPLCPWALSSDGALLAIGYSKGCFRVMDITKAREDCLATSKKRHAKSSEFLIQGPWDDESLPYHPRCACDELAADFGVELGQYKQIEFSIDGRYIACKTRCTVKLWHLHDKQCIAMLQNHGASYDNHNGLVNFFSPYSSHFVYYENPDRACWIRPGRMVQRFQDDLALRITVVPRGYHCWKFEPHDSSKVLLFDRASDETDAPEIEIRKRAIAQINHPDSLTTSNVTLDAARSWICVDGQKLMWLPSNRCGLNLSRTLLIGGVNHLWICTNSGEVTHISLDLDSNFQV